MDDPRDKRAPQAATARNPADIHDNLTRPEASERDSRERWQDMHTIQAGRPATAGNPIRWSGWVIGLVISALLWALIYWIWTAL